MSYGEQGCPRIDKRLDRKIGGVLMFNHIPIRKPLPNLKRKNEDHKRVYYDDEGNRYHSVTNVVGSIDQTGLEEWRKAVGEDVANYVSRKAMNLGTKVHKIIEDNDNIFAKQLISKSGM